MPLCALQEAAAALFELAVALAEPAPEEWGTQVLVSILSCLGCDMLACGLLHSPAVLCLAWGISLCHQVHARVIATCRHWAGDAGRGEQPIVSCRDVETRLLRNGRLHCW